MSSTFLLPSQSVKSLQNDDFSFRTGEREHNEGDSYVWSTEGGLQYHSVMVILI